MPGHKPPKLSRVSLTPMADAREKTVASSLVVWLVVVSALAYFVLGYGIRNHVLFLLNSARKVLQHTL